MDPRPTVGKEAKCTGAKKFRVVGVRKECEDVDRLGGQISYVRCQRVLGSWEGLPRRCTNGRSVACYFTGAKEAVSLNVPHATSMLPRPPLLVSWMSIASTGSLPSSTSMGISANLELGS